MLKFHKFVIRDLVASASPPFFVLSNPNLSSRPERPDLLFRAELWRVGPRSGGICFFPSLLCVLCVLSSVNSVLPSFLPVLRLSLNSQLLTLRPHTKTHQSPSPPQPDPGFEKGITASVVANQNRRRQRRSPQPAPLSLHHAHRSQPRIHIILPVRLLQSRECRFPCAMPRRNPLHFPFVLQVVHQRINLPRRRRHQVQSSKHDLRSRVRCTRLLQYRFNSCMRASIHQQQSIRPFDRQSQFRQLQRPFLLRNSAHQVDSRRYLRCFVH